MKKFLKPKTVFRAKLLLIGSPLIKDLEHWRSYKKLDEVGKIGLLSSLLRDGLVIGLMRSTSLVKTRSTI
jgi:hypothetical protein